MTFSSERRLIIDLIVGARPNFVKVAPVLRALRAEKELGYRVVHTGQHYDYEMDGAFFKGLGIPEPDIHLGVGSGNHGAQTARILERYEQELLKFSPAITVVFGDVNSTVACSLAAVKLGIPVAHVEAGLRSRDRSMPEEINRILTDATSDLLLVSEPSGIENLQAEKTNGKKVHLVGNVMIDTLLAELPKARSLSIPSRYGLSPGCYSLLTMHRPSNVDVSIVLGRLLQCMAELSTRLPLVFAVHPRTRIAISKNGFDSITKSTKSFRCIDPLPYHENLGLMADAKVVLTDSGGIQEETTALNIPCVTMRENTERPVTLTHGTSRLVGNDPDRIWEAVEDVLEARWPDKQKIPLWDGRAAERIVQILKNYLD
ncbi:non-hydrolyzing UDP-N-acetylglucosamine 2-epimerase [Acidobacteriota bacterium]